MDEHGPEFPDAKRFPELADSRLPVEDGTSASELDQQANQETHREQQQQPNAGPNNVEQSFECWVGHRFLDPKKQH